MKRRNAVGKMTVVAWLFMVAGVWGCETPRTAAVTPPAEAGDANTATVAHSVKAMAPVDLELKTSRNGDLIVVRLLITAQVDINQMVGRLTVPQGQPLRGGKGNRDFGAVLRGEKRELEIELDPPPVAGGYRVGAGVDVYLTPNLKRHKGTSIVIGKIVEAEPVTEVVKADGATGGIRVERAESE